MLYIKDGKRYSLNRLNSLGNPENYGFDRLNEQPLPSYDKRLQGIVDAGNVKRDNSWYIDWQVVDLPEEIVSKNLQGAKDSAVKTLFANCNKALEQLAADYPERESQTWPVQLEEANRYLADNTSPTPFISAALDEGETVQQYANLIVSNNAAWSDYAGKVVLKRRTFEQRIKAATTVEELDQIVSEINA